MHVNHYTFLRVLVHHLPKLLLSAKHTTCDHSVQFPSVLFLGFFVLAPTLSLLLHFPHIELLLFHLQLLILLLITQEGLIYTCILGTSISDIILIEVVPILFGLFVQVLPLEGSVIVQELLPLSGLFGLLFQRFVLLQWFCESVLILWIDQRCLLLDASVGSTLEQDGASVHSVAGVTGVRLTSAANVGWFDVGGGSL